MSSLVGSIVSGRYRVESFLGKGGMAEVYKVWDEERNVHLAMKILHADLAEDRVFLRRFKREAETLATLQHPNIVRFYGLEQDGDLVYILMDYVEGTTLRKEIFQANAPLPMGRIQEIMKSVCAALYYAHKLGFVHCDIKPANIMIHNNGTVYLSDFGIARMTEASTVTMVGAGTPAYMSPEQIMGEVPTPQMDIYALGIVLFEMLTGGERPFTGENAKSTGSTSEKVRWEQMRLASPAPSIYNPSIPPEMDKIVLKCLNKSPANRYLTAMDLYGSLSSHSNAAFRPGALPEISQEKTLIERGAARPAGSFPARAEAGRKPAKGKSVRGAIIAAVLFLFFLLAVTFICLFAIFQDFGGFLRTPTPAFTNTAIPTNTTEATSTPLATSTPVTPTFTPTFTPTLTPTFTSTPTLAPTFIPPTAVPTKKPKDSGGGGSTGGPIEGGG